MQHASELLGTPNDDGILQVADENTRGCPHCGAVEVHTAENGKFIWWHAGSECCGDRLTDQVNWRQAEAASLEEELRTIQARPGELRQNAEYALSRGEAERLNRQADRAERRMGDIERSFQARIQAVLLEQAELKRKRAKLAGAA